MLPVAILIISVVLFFWFAFMFTVWAWLQAVIHLCKCQFIRASLWFVTGTWMLFWWYDKPHAWDDFVPGACAFVGLGVLGTAAQHYHRHVRDDGARLRPHIPADAPHRWRTRAKSRIEELRYRLARGNK
jgi:hypothetical protein